MRTCEYAGSPFTEPRSHPWVDAVSDSAFRYVDFSASPALIRTALEDFTPWAKYAAVEAFYGVLERLNHPASSLESNDCAFTGPVAGEVFEPGRAFECSGRLMVLFRELAANTDARVTRLKDELHGELGSLDPAFELGVIGTTLVPARYLELAEGVQLGSQLMISFWAWGESEAGAMLNFARLVKNLARALRTLSARAA